MSRAGRKAVPTAALLVAGVFFLYVCLSSGLDRSEGNVHYLLTQQLLLHHRLSFDQKPALISVLAPNGRYYLMHEFGNSAWMLPSAGFADVLGWLAAGTRRAFDADRLARLLTTFNAAAYVSLGVGACYAIAVRAFAVKPRAALVGALVLALGSQMLAYSDNLFDGVATGCWMSLGVLAAVECRRSSRLALCALAGVLVGMAVITRLTALLAVPGIFVFLLTRPSRGRQAAVGFVLALLPFLVWQAVYNNLRTGSPLQSAEMLPVAHNNYGSTIVGLLGLLVSPGKSVLVYTPALIAVGFGILPAWRRNRAVSLLLVWVVATYVLFVASLADWSGAYGWGPRHFVVIEPLVFVPALLAVERIRSRAAWAALALLGALGFVVNISAMIANWHFRLLEHIAERGGIFSDWSLADSQWLAQMRGLWNNIGVIAGWAQPVVVSDYYAPQAHAANTVDIWWVTAAQFGIPAAAGLAVGASTLVIAAMLLRRAWLNAGRPVARSS